jgi:nucleoside 2-deoxyribosyltransferase
MKKIMTPASCPICDELGNVGDSSRDGKVVHCPACGAFEITGTAAAVWAADRANLTPRQIANIRGWLRHNQGITIGSKDLEMLRAIKTPSVGERAERLLKMFEAELPEVGQRMGMPYSNPSIKQWIATASAIDQDDLYFLVDRYLVGEKRWLETAGAQGLPIYRISPTGHDYLETSRKGEMNSATGFCAMWFSERIKPLWTEAIEPAIQRAGYTAIRIDGVEHNNKVDDEILAHIRRSKFIVADFTATRGGVYFEAGFALGLGKSVIWTTSERRLKRVHFDNRQYNFVTWDKDALEDFSMRLQNRIEATIGTGPLVGPSS